VLQSTLLFLPVDIISFFLAKIKINYKEKIVSAASRIRFFTFIFFLLYVPIRMYYDYSTVSTRIVEYKKPGLPDELEGFRIVFIADVQADRYTNKERLNKYIAESNKTNPDLVLIAGDVITSTPAYIKVAAEALGNIKSKYGVYSCVGDHDNWAYRNDTERSIREISDALFQYNVKMIDNGKLIINAGGSSIGITFITNTYVKRIDQNTIDSLTNNSGAEDLKIFLTHQPRQFLIDYAVNSNYDLFLAGHTHGGQLTFFFPFFNLSPTLIETKYVRGNFHFGSMLAVVNRGLGMSLAPIRYNSTPEVTLIILKSI
jgi:predicted MPP superfamily phosphohydrolase